MRRCRKSNAARLDGAQHNASKFMDSINEGVIAKLKARAEVGHNKYGVTMDREDLTMLQWLQHAQSELMDGAVYLEKLIRLNGTCKWRMRGLIWDTGCDEALAHEYSPRFSDFEFCPFCGRKIEAAK